MLDFKNEKKSLILVIDKVCKRNELPYDSDWWIYTQRVTSPLVVGTIDLWKNAKIKKKKWKKKSKAINDREGCMI